METKVHLICAWIILIINKINTTKTYNIIQTYYNTTYFYDQFKPSL